MGSLTGAEAWVAPEVGASGRWDPSHARAVAPHDDRWWDGRMPSAPSGRPPPAIRAAAFDLGEAQGTDPLSSTARTLLDDVQLPDGRRTVCT